MRNESTLRTDPLIAAIILFSLIIGFSKFHQAEPKSEKSTPAQPAVLGHLMFEESYFDFGNVTEGEVVKHTFKFKNDGAGEVKIVKTETTCGCTTANGALKSYASGESGEMEVVVDTVGKKGVVVKTVAVILENNAKAIKELSLTMNLVPPPHPERVKMPNMNTDARCKTCHLESGQGQTGIFLYHRVCVQCHGKKGVGASARALTDSTWQDSIEDGYLKHRIREGWTEVGMPSYVVGVEPPLDEEQVDSLVRYVRDIKAAP